MSVSIMLSILLVVSFVGTTIWKEKELPDSITTDDGGEQGGNAGPRRVGAAKVGNVSGTASVR